MIRLKWRGIGTRDRWHSETVCLDGPIWGEKEWGEKGGPIWGEKDKGGV